MQPSKSTDKLEVVCESLEKRILTDPILKERVSKISIVWKTECTGTLEEVVVPDVHIEFK